MMCCYISQLSFSVSCSEPLLPQLAEVALSTVIPLFHFRHTHTHTHRTESHFHILHRLHSVSCVVVPLGMALVPYVHAIHWYICTQTAHAQHKSLATTHHTSHTYTCMYVYTLHTSTAITLLHCTSITWLLLYSTASLGSVKRIPPMYASCCSREQQKQAVEWWTLHGCCWVWSQWYGRSS